MLYRNGVPALPYSSATDRIVRRCVQGGREHDFGICDGHVGGVSGRQCKGESELHPRDCIPTLWVMPKSRPTLHNYSSIEKLRGYMLKRPESNVLELFASSMRILHSPSQPFRHLRWALRWASDVAPKHSPQVVLYPALLFDSLQHTPGHVGRTPVPQAYSRIEYQQRSRRT